MYEMWTTPFDLTNDTNGDGLTDEGGLYRFDDYTGVYGTKWFQDTDFDGTPDVVWFDAGSDNDYSGPFDWVMQ